MNMTPNSLELVNRLARKAIDINGKSKSDIEKFSWMVVHEYIHGVMPVEYDIREVDESLYLSVLEKAKELRLNT